MAAKSSRPQVGRRRRAPFFAEEEGTNEQNNWIGPKEEEREREGRIWAKSASSKGPAPGYQICEEEREYTMSASYIDLFTLCTPPLQTLDDTE